jgi:ribosome-binding protein aMBF1 (putative translation factor)
MEEKMLRIRMERRAKGWRLEDLAYHARVSAADISRIETGRLKPYPGHAERLARALGIRAEDLCAEVESSGVAVAAEAKIGRLPR